MAGHSKWANIKHRKEKADKRKGKIFTRLVKEIISAVKQGGPDPKNNAKLKLVIQKAKDANLPNENIERNIKKATSSDQQDFTEAVYELYGHSGVGVLVEIMTDNKNRISSEIRIAINKCGGCIATPGAVFFNFDKKGLLHILKSKALEEELFTIATDNGAEDFAVDEEGYTIVTSPENFQHLKEVLKNKGIFCEEATIEYIPKNYVDCNQEDQQANQKLIDFLENIDDVDNVYHNMSEKEEGN